MQDARAAMPTFSLVAGGPFHRLLRAAGLTGPRMTTVVRGGLLLSAIAWIPLAVASLVEGRAFVRPGGFAWDVGVHARLLGAVPLLFVAELPIGRRFEAAVAYLDAAGLVAADNRPAASYAISAAHRMRDSVWVEAGIAVTVVVGSWLEVLLLPVSQAWLYGGGEMLSVAGTWYALVGVVLYRFLLLRWVWRLVIWTTLLASLARVPLHLRPLHPDRLGGLGVIVGSHQSFGWVVLALSVALYGFLTTRVHMAGAAVLAFRYEVGLFTLLAPLVFLAPPLAFSWKLEMLRRRSAREYGLLAADYGPRWRDTWLRPGSPRLPLDAGDTSTHTDMATSYDRATDIRRIPFRRVDYMFLLACGAVPMLLFLAQSMPLVEVLSNLRKIL